MKPVSSTTSAHIFVCVNRRAATDPLGEGCGARGEALYAEARNAIGAAGLWSRVWLARSYCLGVCPAKGATALVSPGGAVLTEVEVGEAGALVRAALGAAK